MVADLKNSKSAPFNSELATFNLTLNSKLTHNAYFVKVSKSLCL